MSTFVWHKLGSPTLQPSTTSLHAYDGRAPQPHGIFMNVHVELANKIILIDIEVVNAQLNYNLLLGRSYMYVIRAISSNVFQLLIFPHDGNIMTIDLLLYYDPKGLATLGHVLPTIDTTIESVSIPSLSTVGPSFARFS